MTESDEDIIKKINETVQSALQNSSEKKYTLKYRARGVTLSVPPDFKFYKHNDVKNSNTSNNFDNILKSSPHPYLIRSQNQTRINNGPINNQLQTNMRDKINRKYNDNNEIYEIYGQEPKSKHVFAANCKVIDLNSDNNNYFVYWPEPPLDPNDKTPITMAKIQTYLGKHLNLWYCGTMSERFKGFKSLQLYFECFKSKQNEGLTEIFIVCKDVKKTKEDIEKVKVYGLKFSINFPDDYYSDDFESFTTDDQDDVKLVGGETVENDIDNTRKIKVHLIEYNSTVHRGGSYIGNTMGIISGLFVIAMCAIFPR